MEVRAVTPEEHEALAQVTVGAYRALLGPDLGHDYAAELADVSGRAALVEVLVAVDDCGRILGGITYIPGPGPMSWFDRSDQAGMRMLAVDPAAQGRGVGACLVAACLDRAVAAGKTHRLYERAGFRRDPDRDEVLGDGLHLLAYILDLGGRVGPTRPGGGIG